MSLCRFLPAPSDRMAILWSLLCIEGSVVLEYGPAGTTHFSMGLYGSLGIDQQNRLFTTHMSEDDVVMGDVTRLEEAILEVDRDYHPAVIFVVASSISAVIGSDIRGVCTYMQPSVNATLVAFEQGGFRGDYSIGLAETYELLARHLVQPTMERLPGTYNLLGVSLGQFRAVSDAWEIENLMREAFDMRLLSCFCNDTSTDAVRLAGRAQLNLVLRQEAVPAAELLASQCQTPFVTGAPYGYVGTLRWLRAVGEAIGQAPNPALVNRLERKIGNAARYSMYASMRRMQSTPVRRPVVAIIGDYDRVVGLRDFMTEIQFEISHLVCSHALKAIAEPSHDICHMPVEKDRISLLRSLEYHLVFADDVSISLLSASNTAFCVSSPFVNSAQVATHLPILGEKGADQLSEIIELYLRTL